MLCALVEYENTREEGEPLFYTHHEAFSLSRQRRDRKRRLKAASYYSHHIDRRAWFALTKQRLGCPWLGEMLYETVPTCSSLIINRGGLVLLTPYRKESVARLDKTETRMPLAG